VTLSFVQDGQTRQLRTPLVVGADGRASIVRRQAGIELHRDEPLNYIAGLLIDDLGVPDDHDALVAEGDLFFLLFHQGHGRARVYLVVGRSGQHRFSGRRATDRFLQAAALRTFPGDRVLQLALPPALARRIPATTRGRTDHSPTASS
jgi:2-polyprenyl-6-methoxyphenol hydroxylase-like FAD-dependent oxidoreductase